MLQRLNTWLMPPKALTRAENRERITLAILLYSITVAMPVAIFVMVNPQDLSRAEALTARLAIGTVLVMSTVGILQMKRGQYHIPRLIVPTTALLVIWFISIQYNGIRTTSMDGVPAVIVLAGLLLRQRGAALFTVVAMVGFVILFQMEQVGLYTTEFKDINFFYNTVLETMMYYLITGIGISLIMFNLDSVTQDVRKNEEKLNIQNAELIKARASLLAINQELEQRVADRTEELHQAKQDAEKARDQALEADRVKSQFLANMSHELRTPLNAILNFTGFVAKGVMGPVNERQQETLTEAIDSGKHLLSLINDILDITKIEAGLMDLFIQEVDINEIMSATEGIAKGLVKNTPLQLISEIDNDLPKTYGDKRRLRQVMLNMVSNAVKFTPEGQITIRARSENNTIYLSISDTGIGIAPEDKPLVFESFKQAKHDLQEVIGTGLGMPISKAFIELHGGKISLESAVGKGTTVFVELPVLTESEARAINDRLTEQRA